VSGGPAAAASTARAPEATGTPGAKGASGTRSASVFDPALRRFLGWAVFLITSGYTFLDYWNYSRTFHEGGGEWEALLAGRSFAPAQYRIGVLRTADLLARLSHTHLRHMFAAIDFVCLGFSLSLLLYLLSRSEIFSRADRIAQWLQASLALGCSLLYLLWSFWFQKPETHATLLLLVLSAVAAQWRRRVPAAVALIALAAIGATVRADAVIAFHAGYLAACVLPQSRSLPLGRAMQVVASLLSIVAAIGVEYFIMHRMYPDAPRQVAAFQLFSNLKSWMNYLVVGTALFPWWITLGQAVRRWRALEGWVVGLLIGSVVHFALFYVFGIAWEVRIFLPFAMTLVPVTVTLAYLSIDRANDPANFSR
jgi:hypothetical protein